MSALRSSRSVPQLSRDTAALLSSHQSRPGTSEPYPTVHPHKRAVEKRPAFIVVY